MEPELEGNNTTNQERLPKCRERIAKYQTCIAAGYHHTVGLKADGRIVAVGTNKYGQCDTGSWRDIGPASGE